MTVLDKFSDEKLLAYLKTVTAMVLDKAIQPFTGAERTIMEFYRDVTVDSLDHEELQPRFLRNMRQLAAFMPPSCIANAQDVLLMGMNIGAVSIKHMVETRPALARACGIDPVQTLKAFPYARIVARGFSRMSVMDVNAFVSDFRKVHAETLETESRRMGSEMIENFRSMIDPAKEGPFHGMPAKDAVEIFAMMLKSDTFRPQIEKPLLQAIRDQTAALMIEMDTQDMELGLLSEGDYPEVPRFV